MTSTMSPQKALDDRSDSTDAIHTPRPHPLDPLTPKEITQAAALLRRVLGKRSGLIFRVITLAEPAKGVMTEYLAAERFSLSLPSTPARVAMIQYFIDIPKTFRQAKVNLLDGSVFDQEELRGRHPYTDANEMQKAEIACLNDRRVKAAIAKLDLPEQATVIVEPWTYATDGMNDMAGRIIMCYFYARLIEHPDANYYAHPLDICTEMSGDLRVTKVYSLPSGQHDSINTDPNAGKLYDPTKVHQTSEYHPDLTNNQRTSTKPLQILQPEGPSFQVHSNLVTWEKWRLRVGFNYREGLTLHDVTYDNRSLFYRLSLSEMFVPYGDSRAPYPRKAAFDLGNDGAGINANNLKLGCDCLGTVKYFSFWHHDAEGKLVKLPNVVCCHEIDDGILWKHTNFRTQNAVVARSRVLILQTIITVSNYEYIFAFQFGQDASLHYEVRATGILSTHSIDIGDTVPYGTIVAPGVMAPYHQHLFCLRIDSMIDGHRNSLVVEESHPMAADDPLDAFGVGYTTTTKIVENETPFDTAPHLNRIFKIINPNTTNPISGGPVGYKLIPHTSQMLLAKPSSYHARRSEFAAHAVWVTRYHEEERFAAGQHTMQSAGGEGIASWIRKRREQKEERAASAPMANRNADGNKTMSDSDNDSANDPTSVRNQDIVIWHTFGTTHNPRLEDWPVMPCEKMAVGLKPVNFFTGNPGLDVQVASHAQGENGSILV